MKPLIKIYLMLLLIIPDGIISLTSVYGLTTPSFINYDYLNFNFSFLLIPFIFFINQNKMLITVLFILFLEFIRSQYLLLSGQSNYFSFEILISIVFSLLMFEAFKYSFKKKDYEFFLNIFILFHFLGVLVSIFYNLNKLGFRYNAQNLDVGTTGLIFGLIFLLKTLKFKTDKFAWMSFFLLIISGSRFSIFLTIFLLLVNKTFNFNLKYLAVIFVFASTPFFIESEYISRIISSSAEITDFSTKTSFGGRVLSVLVGVELLIDNFFFIPTSSVSLVHLMSNYGYPTFPHSYFLTYLLIAPLLSFYLFYKLINWSFNSLNSLKVYVLIAFFMYGGVIYNFKIYLLFLIIINMVSTISKQNNEILDN